MSEQDARRPALWGGLECSVVRVGDDYRNQIAETGHWARDGDLEQVAALGIRRLRYPVLWEMVSPDAPSRCDWRFSDARLHQMRQLGIQPIAGLLHHGGGPRYTSMLEPDFPHLLAAHAGRVAERYPWIDMYTPVNEPLTTARFSGLYGHWFPHGRDMRTFLRCLVNECLASLLAMREIRRHSPSAQLVQTEDLGRIFSTPRLRAQADHENERRWLSLDLLCGRVDRHHPWHAEMLRHGIGEAELDLLASGEGRPDIVGINYYATSERFLDEELHRYPASFHGGNGRERYADVEALRIDLPEASTGLGPRLAEAWERYGIPLAVTEVHHGSTREEQLRWLAEVWDESCAAATRGIDLRAVTAWSLLGALDWNSLLTERRGFYEVGAFDIRGQGLRVTAIGKALKEIASAGRLTHPVLGQRGWWRREGRHYHSPAAPARGPRVRPRPILILGSDSPLGRELVKACRHRGLEAVGLVSREQGERHARELEEALTRHRPWAVISDGLRAVAEGAGQRPGAAMASGPGLVDERLASLCAAQAVPLVSFSSSDVFGGALSRDYVESDEPCPGGKRGQLLAEAEQQVLDAHAHALILRTSLLFGPEDHPRDVLARCGGRRHAQPFFTATYIPDLVRAALDLLVDGESGIWHLANHGALTPAEVMDLLPVDELDLTASADLVTLGSERGALMPSFADALARATAAMETRCAEHAYSVAAE